MQRVKDLILFDYDRVAFGGALDTLLICMGRGYFIRAVRQVIRLAALFIKCDN